MSHHPVSRMAQALLIGGVLLTSVTAFATPYADAMNHMDDELLDLARPFIQEVERLHPGSTKAALVRARILFLEGKFTEALEKINDANNAPDNEIMVRWAGFENLARATWKVTEGMKTHTTSGGHFIIHHEPGTDEVLLPAADRTLEAAWRTYGVLLGHSPTEPVHVHIYPHIEDLASVSTLTVDEIRTSGTIALCKYNRLMITSPADLLFGYDWQDTLAHEYIHLILIQASHNTIPIWLHEGLAKFLENRWREEADATLNPSSQDLLAQAISQKRLIPFEQMSPSMAKLPSQEDTALAFSEVFTMIHHLKQQAGMSGIRTIIEHMRNGASDATAIASVLSTPFPQLERQWRKSLKQRSWIRLPSGDGHRLHFKSDSRQEDALESIQQEEARRHAYLGDRLRAKKRMKAAALEYEKASQRTNAHSPVIQAKLGTTLVALQRPDEALAALLPSLKFHPEHVLLSLHAGRALLLKKEPQRAVKHLKKAVSLNPFDPTAHEALERAHLALGNKTEAAAERRALNILNASK
jgi:tetratricopeptide (TPR) repeat protein